MKVLRFYLGCSRKQVLPGVIDYLIDAGHFVYFDPSLIEDYQPLLLRYPHNFQPLPNPNPDTDTDTVIQICDYAIDFIPHSYKYPLPVLMAALTEADEGWQMSVLLQRSTEKRVVKATWCREDNHSVRSRIIDELTELFTDSFIHLSRFGEDSLVPLSHPLCENRVEELLACEFGCQELQNVYARLHQDHRLFELSNGQPVDSVERWNMDIEAPFNEQAEVEWFVIWLLALMNGRRGGIFAVDSMQSGKCITLYIDVEATDDCQSLRCKWHDPLYAIVNNRFYEGVTGSGSHVLVCRDVREAAARHALVFAWDINHKALTLSGSQSKDFWGYAQSAAKIFQSTLPDFLTGRRSFAAWLSQTAAWALELTPYSRGEVFEIPAGMIHQCFEQQVLRTPANRAVSCDNAVLTYEELNQRASRLARRLQASVSVEAARIVVGLERSVELVIALIAVSKAGFTWVALDLKAPPARLEGVLEDCHPALILADERMKSLFDKVAPGIPFMNPKDYASFDGMMDNRALCETHQERVAYVIYTSGTTGRPKGVMIEHRALVNTLTWFARTLRFSSYDKLLALTAFSFDIAALEIWMPLLCGGEVVMAGNSDAVDASRLIQLAEQHQVSVMQATPSMWALILDALGERTLPVQVLCGGEPLHASLARRLMRHFSGVWNVYGPTETTIWSTYAVCSDTQNPSLIGRPIGNTLCMVLDDNGVPLPPGVEGELYIGGASLARGYLGNPELTANSFITTDFGRLYKTGDRARWISKGQLEFIGRKDFQVKIRGHRIEIGEIEAALGDIQGVQKCVVIVHAIPMKSDSLHVNHFVAGYYVSDYPLDEEVMLQSLATRLPDVMMPNAIIRLPAIALTPNGKVDRKALPLPDFSSQSSRTAQTPLESRIARIWAETLRLPKTWNNVEDDFFRLGGNSILAIQLVNAINHTLQSDIGIRDLFVDKTVVALAKRVESSIGQFLYKDYVIAEGSQEHLYDSFSLTNVQQSYYWGRFGHFELGNTSTHVYTEFRYRELDAQKLTWAFNVLLRRHAALRTVFAADSQRFLPEVPFYTIHCIDAADEEAVLSIRETLSHKVYAPETWPLFDIVLSKTPNFYLLHLSFDAIFVDMSSFEVLFREWMALYHNPEHAFEELEISFRDYQLKVEAMREGPLFNETQKWWEARLDDYHIAMNLPLVTRPAMVSQPKFRRLSQTIDLAIWERISDKASRMGISPTAVVLEIYARILAFWSGQDRLAVNLTLFNRFPLHRQVNQLIGDFTALELFAWRHSGPETIKEVLAKTHETLMRDIEHNLFDGVDFQRLLRKARNLPSDAILSPVVLTSVLGTSNQGSLFHLPINETYEGIHYAISQTSQVWLDNKAWVSAEGFVAEWDYVEELFDEHVIKAMHQGYCALFNALAERDWSAAPFPEPALPKLHEVLIESANAALMPMSELTLPGMCARYCEGADYAERTAVIDAGLGRSFSWRELGADSHRMAARLHALGKRKGLVGILSEKGYLQVVTTLGVMQSGHAYLPLHVEWPVGRLQDVLIQGGVETVVVSSRMARDAAKMEELRSRWEVLVCEDLLSEPLLETALPVVSADDVAYVIFTSGSTGKPKGVTISHRGAVNTILAVNQAFGVGREDRVLALSELSFDLSVYDLFGVLGAGGAVVFPRQEETKEPKHWLSLIREHGVTLWNTVPQLASLLVDEAEAGLAGIRAFLLSGDWIPVSLPARLKACSPEARVMSLGGATEGSIWSIWYPVDGVPASWTSIPYGVAMPNQKMYVLNRAGGHCPTGVMGEIHIGGVGVALNYWGDKAATERQFYEHPELGRLYRTGDCGRWHPDGYMEFCGRTDFQVKINGYRVELEEISASLERLEGIAAAAVSLQNQENRPVLAAYLVKASTETTNSLDADAFRLQQHGLIKNLPVTLQRHPVSPDSLMVRKSYRDFIDVPLNTDRIQSLSEAILKGLYSRASASGQALECADTLLRVLSAIACFKVSGLALPKYPWPSAGNTYSVRCFVTLAADIKGLPAGSYYWQPQAGALCATERDIGGTEKPALHLVAHWPAIKPLYPDKAMRLACLETGHMLECLSASLAREGIGFSLEVQNRSIDKDNTLIATVWLDDDDYGGLARLKGLRSLVRHEARYCDDKQQTVLDLDALPVFKQLDDFAVLLRAGGMMLIADGKEAPAELVTAGFLFQAISSRLYADNVGSCMLGFLPDADALYVMALGSVTDAMKRQAECRPKPASLKEIVNRLLSRHLPDYMLPKAYAVLDELPLSPNGKLDSSRLPALQAERNHIAPANPIESGIVDIWARMLGTERDDISVEANFFALGGNSLIAMQVVRQLGIQLGMALKLSDFYRLNTVREIAAEYSLANTVREEGVL